jgi:hypothetical protein
MSTFFEKNQFSFTYLISFFQKKRNTFSPLHIWDSFKVTFRRRAGPNRKYIWLMILIHFSTFLPFFGEMTVAFSYVRIRYSWGVDEYSTYSSIVSSSSIVAQAIFMPLVSLLKVNEAWIMIFCFVSLIARHVVKGFASEPWMYYLGKYNSVLRVNCRHSEKPLINCHQLPSKVKLTVTSRFEKNYEKNFTWV